MALLLQADGWTTGRAGKWADGRAAADGPADGLTDGWENGRASGRTDGQTDGQASELVGSFRVRTDWRADG